MTREVEEVHLGVLGPAAGKILQEVVVGEGGKEGEAGLLFSGLRPALSAL